MISQPLQLHPLYVLKNLMRMRPLMNTNNFFVQRDLRRGMRTMEARKPFMIGVAGGTASGKSTVCDLLMEKLGQHEVNMDEKQVVHLSQDSFYRELTHAGGAEDNHYFLFNVINHNLIHFRE